MTRRLELTMALRRFRFVWLLRLRRIRGLPARVRWGLVSSVTGVLIVVGALLMVIVYLPPLAKYPSGLTGDQLATHVDNLRGHILQGLDGLALLGTLYFSARTLRLNRRGQVTERFTKAIEQLASEKLAVRLGGIYALEQIALDSEELHWSVMEVLTAFLRENSATHSARSVIDALEDFERGQPLAWPPEQAHTMQPKLATDVQAIATVLGRRPEYRRRQDEKSGRRLDLSGVWLPKAVLASAHLERAHLNGAHLEWSILIGTHLDRAHLLDVHLEGAVLRRARLAGAVLDRCQLRGADLHGANFEQAKLWDAHLESADLSDAQLQGVVLRTAHLAGANLRGANLEGTDLTATQLQEVAVDGSTVLPEHLLS